MADLMPNTPARIDTTEPARQTHAPDSIEPSEWAPDPRYTWIPNRTTPVVTDAAATEPSPGSSAEVGASDAYEEIDMSVNGLFKATNGPSHRLAQKRRDQLCLAAPRLA